MGHFLDVLAFVRSLMAHNLGSCLFSFVSLPGCTGLPSNFHIINLHTSGYKMLYFYLIFISGHLNSLWLKALRRFLHIFDEVSQFVLPSFKMAVKP